MVLKRVPLGSQRAKFFIPGRKFVSGRNWGEKSEDENALNLIICLTIRTKLHEEIRFVGNAYSTQGQAVLATVRK